VPVPGTVDVESWDQFADLVDSLARHVPGHRTR